MKLSDTLRQRRRRIRRRIEAARLRRIRRHTRPGYTRCMNCGTTLKGMYCHQCGQYALDIHQPIWKYIRQYFENVYQFDGKIWMTLRLMFTRPGFLTNEFNEGKINSYVHPFRLYMCISVVFFTFFFMVAERQTGKALNLMYGSRIPTVVVDSLKTGRWTRPDTTVYLYNAQRLTQVLELKGIAPEDGIVRPHYGNHTDRMDLVTLPRLLFDAVVTRTVLHEDDRTSLAGLRTGLRNLKENGALNELSAEGLLDRYDMDTDAYRDLRFFLEIPADSTGRITADFYDWMPQIDQSDQLHNQATASFILGQLSKWTPFYMMFLLPLQALLFKAIYPRRRYMEHFAHSTHLSTVLQLAVALPAFIALSHFNMGNNSSFDLSWAEQAVFAVTPWVLPAYQLVSMHTVYREDWGKTTLKCLLHLVLFLLLSLSMAGGLITWLVGAAMGRV